MSRTLKEHRAIAAALLGEESPAVKYLDDKITQGGDDEVVIPESQLVSMLMRLHVGEVD